MIDENAQIHISQDPPDLQQRLVKQGGTVIKRSRSAERVTRARTLTARTLQHLRGI